MRSIFEMPSDDLPPSEVRGQFKVRRSKNGKKKT